LSEVWLLNFLRWYELIWPIVVATYVAIFKMENDDQAPEMLFFPSIFRELLAQVHCAEPRLGLLRLWIYPGYMTITFFLVSHSMFSVLWEDLFLVWHCQCCTKLDETLRTSSDAGRKRACLNRGYPKIPKIQWWI
jgi:hypothetical protein